MDRFDPNHSPPNLTFGRCQNGLPGPLPRGPRTLGARIFLRDHTVVNKIRQIVTKKRGRTGQQRAFAPGSSLAQRMRPQETGFGSTQINFTGPLSAVRGPISQSFERPSERGYNARATLPYNPALIDRPWAPKYPTNAASP